MSTNPDLFVSSFQAVEQQAHENSVNHGFWEGPQNMGEKLALIHSEVSEILEALREGNPASVKIPEFSSMEEELADVVIRAMDFAGGQKLRLAEAILAKMAYNLGRPKKHNKAF